MRRLLLALVLLAGCAHAGPYNSHTSYLRLVNSTSHLVRVYYVRGNQWYRLTRANMGAGSERRVQLPTGARDGSGKVLLAVEYMDGLLDKSQRQGTAMMPFFVRDCTEITVRISYPAGGTGRTSDPDIDLCEPGPGY